MSLHVYYIKILCIGIQNSRTENHAELFQKKFMKNGEANSQTFENFFQNIVKTNLPI